MPFSREKTTNECDRAFEKKRNEKKRGWNKGKKSISWEVAYCRRLQSDTIVSDVPVCKSLAVTPSLSIITNQDIHQPHRFEETKSQTQTRNRKLLSAISARTIGTLFGSRLRDELVLVAHMRMPLNTHLT